MDQGCRDHLDELVVPISQSIDGVTGLRMVDTLVGCLGGCFSYSMSRTVCVLVWSSG